MAITPSPYSSWLSGPEHAQWITPLARRLEIRILPLPADQLIGLQKQSHDIPHNGLNMSTYGGSK